MPLITLGSGNQLVVKVPSKGDTDWANDFKTEFAQKIVEHDHTGSGKGSKIVTAAIEDGAVTNAKLDSATQTSIGNISTNTSNIATNTSNIATNTSNISTNTSNISTNTTNITSNTNRVLSSISDVSTSSPSNGEVLAYNSTSGEWEPSTGGGASALNDLSDVTITGTPSNDQFLRYNSSTSVFENESVTIPSALNDLSNVNANPGSTSHYLRWSGSNWYSSGVDFANLQDVNLSSPSAGETLQFAQVGPDLVLQNVAGGGGGGVDTIANASEASSYSGTGNIVLITSTSDVEFTNSYEDKVFYCNTAISIKFSSQTLKNVSVLHTTQTSGKLLQLWSPNQGSNTSSQGATYTNCDFRANRIQVMLGLEDAYQPFSTDDTFLPTYFVACDIKCLSFNIEQSLLSDGSDPRSDFGFFVYSECHFQRGTTLNCWELTHQKYTVSEGGSQYSYLPEIYATHSTYIYASVAKSEDGGTTMSSAPSSGVLANFTASNGSRIIVTEGTGSNSERLWVNNLKGDAHLNSRRLEFTGNYVETKHNPAELDLSTNQALSGTSFTKINFDIVNSNLDKMWDSGTSRWEIPATQQYEMQVYIVLTGVDSAAQVEVRHGLNGVAQTKQFPYLPYLGSTTRVLSMSKMFNFSASQTVDLHVQLSTGTASVSSESFAVLRPVKQYS